MHKRPMLQRGRCAISLSVSAHATAVILLVFFSSSPDPFSLSAKPGRHFVKYFAAMGFASSSAMVINNIIRAGRERAYRYSKHPLQHPGQFP